MIELFIYFIILFSILLPSSYILGKFISDSFLEETETSKDLNKLQSFFQKIESPIYKLCGIDPNAEMKTSEYFGTIFYSNILLCVICFIVLYFQNNLPFRGNIEWKLDIPLILHILSSQITNTCQTHHISETQLTPLSNYYIMPLLMFYSSGSGIATAMVFMRGLLFGRIGNSYVDIIKAMTRVLIPLSLLSSIIFAALGLPNTFISNITYETLEKTKEILILGPIAAFEAIKLIGENGLSCLTANSAHPFENPSYLSNFFQIYCILLVPTALLITFGLWLKNKKQTIIILSVLFLVLIFEIVVVNYFEIKGNIKLNDLLKLNDPNWVGKETRLGIIGSSIFTALVSNVSGSANSSFDSFHPIAVALALFNLSNQSFFGVQGFGLVFTINFIIYTAFLTGLMLGKTPEIFGKRIGKDQIILSSILILINPVLVLIGTAITLIIYPDTSPDYYTHIHYYTRVFYEFASGAASNGSGLEGLNDNTPYWNSSLALVMFIARYAAMSSMIFLGGSFIKKPSIPKTTATLQTDSLLFGFILLFFSIISTLLTYIPFVILGPIAEMLIKW